ncbi:MAG: hypothetical protein HRO68_05210 [Nitrosopumilus sp.]|nr:hypothetical protein [Nitrosopumilus sp.]
MINENECSTGSSGGKKGCNIAEINMDNVQFYRKHTPTECFFSAGKANSKILLKFTVKFADKTFRYVIHPDNNWLKLFSDSASVLIVDHQLNMLAGLTLNKEEVTQRISEASKNDDSLQGENE